MFPFLLYSRRFKMLPVSYKRNQTFKVQTKDRNLPCIWDAGLLEGIELGMNRDINMVEDIYPTLGVLLWKCCDTTLKAMSSYLVTYLFVLLIHYVY